MPLTAEEWLTEIDNGLKYREIFGKEAAWHKLELDYTNDPAGDTAMGSNLVWSMGDSLLSSLSVPDPEIVVTPTHPSGVDRAPVVESLSNWYIPKLKMKKKVDLALCHSYLYSRAIGKLGYDSEFGWNPLYDIGPGNNPYGTSLTQFDRKTGKRIEFMNTTPGMPWFSFCFPHDIVVPWGVVDLDDAPWIAHRFIRMTSHLKKDVKYKNTSRLQAQMCMEDFVNSYTVVGVQRKTAREHRISTTSLANTQILYNECWEIHDREDGKVKVVTYDHDKFLRNEQDYLQTVLKGELPFVSGTFAHHPRSFWGTPLAYYLGQIQSTEYDIAIQSEKQRRINNLKFIIAKNFMKEDKLNRLISGDVGAAEVADVSRDLREQVVPFPQGSHLDFVMQSENNRKNARDAIGFSRNQLGEFDASSRRTAREATFVQQGSMKRESKRASMVEALYTEAVRKLNKIVFNFWTVPKYIMSGNDWVKFTGQEIEGDYLYDLSLANKRQVSRSQRKVEALMTMMQIMSIPGINPQAALKYIIDASADPAFERILMPAKGQVNPAAQGALPTIPSTQAAGAGR